MYINVSLEAVRAAEETIKATKSLLVQNHGNFASDMEGALAEWNDVNVQKFIALFGEMTGDLNLILAKLSVIEEFCYQVERMILLYND